MPELPEVEVTRRLIEPLLVGRRISSVRTTRDSYFFLTKPATLKRNLLGRRVVELSRRGKYLLAQLDDGKRLMLHLGMTGQLFSQYATSVRLLSASRRSSLSPEAQLCFEPDTHTHLQLRFEDRGPDVFFRTFASSARSACCGGDRATRVWRSSVWMPWRPRESSCSA